MPVRKSAFRVDIRNALMSEGSPEAKQLAINTLAQAVGTRAVGIAAGVGINKLNTSESAAANGVKNSPEMQASVDSKLTNLPNDSANITGCRN